MGRKGRLLVLECGRGNSPGKCRILFFYKFKGIRQGSVIEFKIVAVEGFKDIVLPQEL